MRQSLTIFYFILFTSCATAQPTIEIYLTNHPYPNKGSAIERIEETYELKIQEIPPSPFKIVILLDKAGYQTSETKLGKTGGKQSETKWEYNQSQKLTRKTHHYFVNMLGWKSEESILVYNDTSGFLSEIRIKKNEALESISKVLCDTLGNPYEVRVMDEKGGFTMIEKISYSPNANIIRVMQIKPTGQLFNRWSYPIDSAKPLQTGQVEIQYWPNGELMLESLDKQTKTDQGYYYEYRFDSQENWVVKDTYQVTLGRNNKIKDKKLEHTVLRAIKYY